MKRFVVRFAIASGIILCLLATAFFALWGLTGFAKSSSDADDQFAEWKANGLPVTSDELFLLPPPKPQENAAVQLNKLFEKGVHPFELETDTVTPAGWKTGATQRDLKKYSSLLEDAKPLINLPRLRIEKNWKTHPDKILLPEFSQWKILAILFCLQAELRARDGDFEGAIENLLIVQRFAMLIRQEPLYIQHLVGDNIEDRVARSALVISRANLKRTDRLEKLVAVLDAYPSSNNWTQIFRFESFYGLQVLRNGSSADALDSMNDDENLRRFLRDKPPTHFVDDGLPASTIARAVAAEHMRFWNQYYPRVKSGEDIYVLGHAMNLHHHKTYSEGAASVFLATFPEARNQYQSSERSVIKAYFRVLIFKNKAGRWPKSLKEAGVAEVDSKDIVSGKPIGYQITPQGFKVWSTGRDRIDNGGISSSTARKTRSSKWDFVLSYPPE